MSVIMTYLLHAGLCLGIIVVIFCMTETTFAKK